MIFHQVSINLEILAYAGPVALWHAHHQSLAGKKLSLEFWQNHPETTEPPLQTFWAWWNRLQPGKTASMNRPEFG